MKCYNSIESLKILRERLEQSERVFFTRFGDNDIMMMMGTDQHRRPLNRPMGGNKTIFSFALQLEMTQSYKIQDINYLKGASTRWDKEPMMTEGFHEPFKHSNVMISALQKLTNDKKFLLPVLFQYLIIARPKIFDNFVESYIAPHEKLFIGCVDPKYVQKIIGKVNHYVNVPDKNAYGSINSWYPQVQKIIDTKNVKVIIPNAGQATRVIQKRLWETNKNLWSFDMGSIFDAWNPTRTWLRMKGQEIVQRYG